MKRLLSLLLALGLALLCLPPPALAAQADALGGDYAPGEALVLYRAQAAGAGMRAAQSTPDFGAGIRVEAVYDLAQTKIEVYAADAGGAQAAQEAPLSIAHVSAGMETEALVASLCALPFVEAAEPNWRYTLNAAFSDPYYASGLQWPLSEPAGVLPDALWADPNVQREAAGAIVVAVLDTGVDYANPDLKNRLTPQAQAFDAYPQAGRPIGQETAQGGHGTHVAGIIAAATNNAAGMAGLMGQYAQARIMPVKVFGGDTAYLGDIVAGVAHVIAQKQAGVNVIAANMSFGSESNHTSAITSYALTQLGEAGILPVRSAGNTCRNIESYSTYPAVYENPYTVAVGAAGRDGAFASAYSNYSASIVHMAAPGTAILSTYLMGHGGFVDSSGAPRVFDNFENTAVDYPLTLAPADWSGQIVTSNARTFTARPESDGYYRRGHSLQFTLTPTAGYYDYRLTLPGALSALTNGETMGLRIRAEASDGGTAQGILCIGAPPVVKSPLDNDTWTYLSLPVSSDGQAHLWLSYYGTGKLKVSIDDLGVKNTNAVAYAYADGTSMAAPHVSGAYALMYAADPAMTLAERRARLIGSVRAGASFAGKVNASGTLDLSDPLNPDTSAFAPVIDKIEQNGREVTVSGWFFGDAPTAALEGRALAVQATGSGGPCTLTFTLRAGVSGVKTLTLTKENGRSFRMRYRYDAQGNMTEVCDAPETPLVRTLVNDGDTLYCLCSTVEGFSLYRLAGDTWQAAGTVASAGDRASRDDFTTFVSEGVLYVYDYNHVHRFDLASGAPLADLPGPDTLLGTDAGFRTGAVVNYNGRLMILGGSYFADVGGVRTRLYRDNVCVFDPATNTWADAEAFPGVTLSGAQAVVCGGELFLFASTSTPQGGKKLLRFDGAAWSQADIPYDLSGKTFGVLEGKILCFGDGDAAAGILRYDPASSAWDRLPYWGTGLPYTARGAVAGDRIYAITALQTMRRFILQTVRPQRPVPVPPAPVGGGGSGDFLPTPTPTPAPVPVPPATGGAPAGLLLLLPLASLPLLWAARRKRG